MTKVERKTTKAKLRVEAKAKAKAAKRTSGEAMAKVRMLRTSPRKLNLVAESIRGLKVDKALAQLTFSKKRISEEVKKLLLSAIANAENNFGLDIDRLEVREAYVGKAMVMKRFQAGAKGRGNRILKPFSNMTIVVVEKKAADAKVKKEAKKAPQKAADKKEKI
ncbi:MAG: 50S ribosomal protein L22 [Lactobacillales bacterium]|jgi:large subunit ribosomal protein L22|nr:50S ribosomal protein L22 [Lactobacillales bacterium]